MRDNTWNTIETIEGTPSSYSDASRTREAWLLYNTAIHWLACRDDLLKDVILAFDLMERKLFEISLPDDFDHEHKHCDLWVFGKLISLWAMNYNNYTIEIWVMKEYKVHSSWTKTLVLSVDGISTVYVSPICSTKRGDIIGTVGNGVMVKFDNKGQLLEHCSCRKNGYLSLVVMYTESLLSFPSDN